MNRKIEPVRRIVCTVCWVQKSITSFSIKQRGSPTPECNTCLRMARRLKKSHSGRLRKYLRQKHKKAKHREEWVDWDRRDTRALEKAVLAISDDAVESPHHIYDALAMLLRAYGGLKNMAEVIAVDLFSERVTEAQRLRHHRLMLALIVAQAKLESARASEQHRLKMARAITGASQDDMPNLACDEPAMKNAALPIIALAKHGVLHMVLEWCIQNGHVCPVDIPDVVLLHRLRQQTMKR